MRTFDMVKLARSANHGKSWVERAASERNRIACVVRAAGQARVQRPPEL